jgi:hypothetical protein
MNIVEDYADDPEDRHDAWIYDVDNDTLYFLHGGHHVNIFEKGWLDPDDLDDREAWMGDIENGQIRFYENMREKYQPWESPNFINVIEQVKKLSDDYAPEDISTDFHTHARIVKKAFEDTEFRWLYDPVNGLTVWPTDSWAGEKNFHSTMLERILGPEYYNHDNYTGGYIYPPEIMYPLGRVRQTYKSYDNPRINVDGLAAIEEWMKGSRQVNLMPHLMPYSKTALADQLEETMRWIYAPRHGGLQVWPFYQKNHGDVLDEIGIYEYLPIDPDSPIQVDEDWCGGYIERDGTVWETYSSPSNQTNTAGVWAARAWAANEMYPPIQGLAANEGIRSADYKWAFTEDGQLDVWPVDELGNPQHLFRRGRDGFNEESQGHIYDIEGQIYIYTHPTRPQQKMDEPFSEWQVRKDALNERADPAVRQWIQDNSELFGQEIKESKIRPIKKKRHHLRKRDYVFFLGFPCGGAPQYPVGGQVDTTGI